MGPRLVVKMLGRAEKFPLTTFGKVSHQYDLYILVAVVPTYLDEKTPQKSPSLRTRGNDSRAIVLGQAKRNGDVVYARRVTRHFSYFVEQRVLA
jgi:hypothetical protein